MNYFIAKVVICEGDCFVSPDPHYAGRASQIFHGSPAVDFPKDLVLPMANRKRFPGTRTPDLLANQMQFLLASIRLVDLLRKELGDSVQYLPFSLLNHKRKKVPGFGFIVNLLGTVDCVDLSLSEGRRSATKPDRFMIFSRLVLDRDRIPGDLKAFRILSKPDVTIVREDLRQKLENEKVTGITFYDLGKQLPPLGI